MNSAREKINAAIWKLWAAGHTDLPVFRGAFGSPSGGGCCDFWITAEDALLWIDTPPPFPVPEPKRVREPDPDNTTKSKLLPKLGAEQGWMCKYCTRQGTPAKDPDGRTWHIDHVIPRSRGGMAIPNNRVLACRTCNISKRNKTGDEFRIWLAANGLRALDKSSGRRMVLNATA